MVVTLTEKMQFQNASWKEVYAEAESRAENSILSENDTRAKRHGEQMSHSAWKNRNVHGWIIINACRRDFSFWIYFFFYRSGLLGFH
jgi:hypothetical protein